MMLSRGTFVAVADGEKLALYRNSGDEANLSLVTAEMPEIDASNSGSGGRHFSSAANPDDSQQAEDNQAAGVIHALNREVLEGKIDSLLIIAAPRTLGEMRKHYHKSLSAVLKGEIDKDLTGHSLADIEKAINAK